MDDPHVGEALAEVLAGLQVLFNDLHRDTRAVEDGAKVLGSLAAAHHHNVLHGAVLVAHGAEELKGVAGGGDDRDDILLGEDEMTVGDVGLVPALHGADQHVAGELGDHVLDRHTRKDTALGDLVFEQLHPSAGEGVDPDGRGETQDTGDLGGGGLLGVDDHSQAQLVLEVARLAAVGGVLDSGDGLAVARLLGDETAEQVQLVGARDRDEQVGLLDPRLLLEGMGGSVAHEAHDVQARADVPYHIGAGVDHGYAVAVLIQLLGQGLTHLAAANDYNIHRVPFLVRPIAEARCVR